MIRAFSYISLWLYVQFVKHLLLSCTVCERTSIGIELKHLLERKTQTFSHLVNRVLANSCVLANIARMLIGNIRANAQSVAL